MKRLFGLIILTLVLALSLGPVLAYAEDSEISTPTIGDFLKVTGTVTLLAGTRDADPFFVIPKTYYVELVKIYKDGSYQVKYLDMTGDVDSSQISNLEAVKDDDRVKVTADNAALNLKLALKNTEDAALTYIPVDEDGVQSSEVTLPYDNSLEFKYYGTLTIGETEMVYIKNLTNTDVTSQYCYIAKSNLLVVSGTSTADLDTYAIADHINSQPEEAFNPNDTQIIDDPTQTKDPDDGKLLRVLLIAGITIAGILIFVLLFKPSNTRRGSYDYDRNRHYDYGPSPYDRPRSRRDDYNDYRRDDYYRDDRRRDDYYRDDRRRRDDYYDDRRRHDDYYDDRRR